VSALDARLLDAHEQGDAQVLITLYTEAAEAAPDDGARAFFLTHAMVFALEAGDPRAVALKARLVSLGRETE